MSGADEGGQAGGDKWGDEISDERKAELEQRFQAWEQEAEHGERKGPFDTLGLSYEKRVPRRLTGADVFWLSARAQAGTSEEQVVADQMEFLRRARADRRLQAFARHRSAGLHLEGADLTGAQLESAVLIKAHLEGANLTDAHLEGANLTDAHLEGAALDHAYLDAGTDLQGVIVSDRTGWLGSLFEAILRRRGGGAVTVADVRWNGADLTRVNWSVLRRLGDEGGDRWWWRSREEAEYATRANIQLSKQLDNAGLKDDSDRFAYRAQVCQRGVHLLRFRLGRWLFSWLLFILAGYGYRPLRTLFWYLAVIGSFAFAYFQATHGALTFGLPPSQIQPLPWYEALVLSVSSFHGRGFFQPVQSLGDPVAILAAIEAVFGLFIEVSFIATFTQRYFGK